MSNPFRYFNSSPEVIRLVVMMYVRYPLSLPNVARHLWRAFSILCCPPFELKRADEVERRMAADGIVEAVDVTADCARGSIGWVPRVRWRRLARCWGAIFLTGSSETCRQPPPDR